MILYYYIHWFWITSLLASPIAVNTIKGTSNGPILDTLNRTTNVTLTYTTINPANNTNLNLKSTLNAATEQTLNDQSVIEANSTAPFTVNGTSECAENTTLDSVTDLFSNDTNISMDKMGITSTESNNLSAAGIAGITLACVIIVSAVTVTSVFLYKNRGFNHPQVLGDHCSNLDSSGYIDDTSIRDNSEEMYSLDNDSFLNSLEVMTFQNYWTDNVKHTKL